MDSDIESFVLTVIIVVVAIVIVIVVFIVIDLCRGLQLYPLSSGVILAASTVFILSLENTEAYTLVISLSEMTGPAWHFPHSSSVKEIVSDTNE